MSKKRKFRKSDKKNLSKANTTVEKAAEEKNVLKEQIEKAATGLYYISETDAEISSFVGDVTETVSKEEILAQTKNAADAPIEERSFAEFFARLTEIQDWFGDEEKETARKFAELKQVLENNIRDLKVFKIGKIQLDIYVVGLEAENRLTGIKTKAVET